MKISPCFLLVLAACFYPLAGMAQNAAKPMQAELMRSTSGREIEDFGLASGSTPLQKGAVYDVVRQENGGVVLSVGGKNVLVQNDSVSVTEKPQTTATSSGFVPGKVVLISAKYTIEGDQPRNVKNNLKKLIPETLLKEPLEIIVTDALSLAAQDQGQSQRSIVVTRNAVGVFTRTPAKNVLTVQYIYNGQRFTKQVPEGEKLVLP
ncbi:hypothetical protein [Prosthecobacter sp.]|uniref:hypothetical protein n=1 Tax=Prosthecobacter sp. TaxID=1965333 RepID=UPI00248922BF|nr:hypothetical protein [Prosthecobacter sp.]MDI1313845.1 hypothetical protein [Prosthecobacter sp.]